MDTKNTFTVKFVPEDLKALNTSITNTPISSIGFTYSAMAPIMQELLGECNFNAQQLDILFAILDGGRTGLSFGTTSRIISSITKSIRDVEEAKNAKPVPSMQKTESRPKSNKNVSLETAYDNDSGDNFFEIAYQTDVPSEQS